MRKIIFLMSFVLILPFTTNAAERIFYKSIAVDLLDVRSATIENLRKGNLGKKATLAIDVLYEGNTCARGEDEKIGFTVVRPKEEGDVPEIQLVSFSDVSGERADACAAVSVPTEATVEVPIVLFQWDEESSYILKDSHEDITFKVRIDHKDGALEFSQN